MKKKILIIIFILLFVLLVIIIKLIKPSNITINNIKDVSQLVSYSFESNEIQNNNNLYLICTDTECNLYDYSVSLDNPIENLKTNDNEYLPNYIHFGSYDEKYIFKTKDNLPNEIDLINDFYIIYSKKDKTYTREIKIRGEKALVSSSNDKYIIYKENNQNNYFLLPYGNNFSSKTYILKDNKVANIYHDNYKDKSKLYVTIYNDKTGQIINEYSFNYNNEYSYGYNKENVLMIFNKNNNILLNLDTLKKVEIKKLDLTYDNYILDNNKLYDNKLNIIKIFNKNENPIFINTEEDVIILYEKENKIYNLKGEIIYILKNDEKYYEIENALVIYNKKYISKIIDSNGKILLNNDDNIYDIDANKKDKIDLDGNIVSFDKNMNAHIKNSFSLNETNYKKTVYNKYFDYYNSDYEADYIVYNHLLNKINSFKFNTKDKIKSIELYDYYNQYLSFDINIKDNDIEYTEIYIYDVKNNKLLFNEPIKINYETNAIYADINSKYMVIINESNIYFVEDDKIIKLINDLNVKYISNYYKDYSLLEAENKNYLIDLNKLK